MKKAGGETETTGTLRQNSNKILVQNHFEGKGMIQGDAGTNGKGR